MNGWLALAAAVGSMAYKASADDALRVALSGLDAPPYQRPPRYRVSLVTIAYNEHKYIGNLLRSASNQTEPFAEMIVADCSDPGEGTLDVCRSWGATVVPVDRGNLSASRNSGAAAATGDILVFDGADHILSPYLVELAVDALESGARLAEPHLALYDSSMWNLAAHFTQMININGASTCVALWAKDFWDVGGYDVSCNMIANGNCAEDTEFLDRVASIYGPGATRLLSTYIGTSARRLRKFGLGGYGGNFATPVRSYQQEMLA